MNAAGSEWVRNDFGGRAVNPSTGLAQDAAPFRNPAARIRAAGPPTPTGAVRQTVYDLDQPEFIRNAAGSEWVRNDFGGRSVNPSDGLIL
jgi:hypothetical protein